MTRSNQETHALRDVWGIATRYPWRFIVPAFLAAALVLLAGLMLPRKYQAEAIFDRRTDMVLAEMTSRGASQTFQNPRQSLIEELSGPPAIDALLRAIRPELEAELGPAAASSPSALGPDLRRRLLIRYDIATNDLDRVRVSYVSENSVLARRVVNGLVEGYIARTRAAMDQRLRQAEAFFEKEAQRERTLIQTLENQQLAFEIRHADLLPDNPHNLQASLGAARLDLADLEQKLQAAQLREQALRQSLESTTETTPSTVSSRNPELERLGAKKRELETQLAQYVGVLKMTERHPDLIVLRQQIAEVDAAIAETPTEVVVEKQVTVNPKRAEIDLLLSQATAERKSLEAQLEALKRRVRQLNADSADLFPVRSDYRKLSREVEQHQRQLAFWEDNLRRVRMALTAESGNRGVQLDFVKPAERVTKPISPNLAQLLLAALGLGGLVGAASVVVAHRSDESFGDGQSLAGALSLPLLGTVSEIISRRQQRLRQLRAIVLYPANVTAMACVLLALAGVLYLHLERPRVLTELKSGPTQFVVKHLTQGKPAIPAAE